MEDKAKTSVDELISDMSIDECIDSIISELDTPIERRRHTEEFNKMVAKVAEVRTRNKRKVPVSMVEFLLQGNLSNLIPD